MKSCVLNFYYETPYGFSMGQVWRTFPLNHPQSGLTHFKTGSHDGSVELICGRNRRLEFCIGEYIYVQFACPSFCSFQQKPGFKEIYRRRSGKKLDSQSKSPSNLLILPLLGVDVTSLVKGLGVFHKPCGLGRGKKLRNHS